MPIPEDDVKMEVDVKSPLEGSESRNTFLYLKGKPWCNISSLIQRVESKLNEAEELNENIHSSIIQYENLFRSTASNDSKDFMDTDAPNAAMKEDILEVQEIVVNTKARLPSVGELKRKKLSPGEKVWALNTNLIAAWTKAVVIAVKETAKETLYKIRIEHSNAVKLYPGKSLAYDYLCDVTIPVGTRVIARYSELRNSPNMFSGVIGEPPKITNQERYLVFFDDGYAQYTPHEDLRVVCAQSNDVANDVYKTVQLFIRSYLARYPERAMVKLQKDQIIKIEYNGEWSDVKVLVVDGSLVKLHFIKEQKSEWLYRGCPRLKPLFTELANAEAHRSAGRQRRHKMGPRKPHQPYVEYTRDNIDVVTIDDSGSENEQDLNSAFQLESGEKKVRNTARKSTSKPHQSNKEIYPCDIIRTPDIKSHTGYKDIHQLRSFTRIEYFPHECGVQCREKGDPATYQGRKNPLLIPILLGWERQLRKYHKYKQNSIIMYRAPCGRHLRNLKEIQDYLFCVKSKITIDYFSADPEVIVFRTFRPKEILFKNDDITEGKENTPVSVVNSFANEPPPPVEYCAVRFPGKDVFLNLSKDFLCGCDCTDNCQNPAVCQCMQLTNYAKYGKKIGDAGYKFRRLREQTMTGIFECNELCKCNSHCGNRVVQNGMLVRLQMFKTQFKGWGIRCLDDIDAGTFICMYAGQISTDNAAEQDGKEIGDEYLAELDHIETVEKHKEGYESDVSDIEGDCENKIKSNESNEASSDIASSASDSDINVCDEYDSDFETSSLRTTASSTYATRSKRKNGVSSSETSSHAEASKMEVDDIDDGKELPDLSPSFDTFSIVPRPLSPTSAELVEKAEMKREPIIKDKSYINEDNELSSVVKKSVTAKHSFMVPVMNKLETERSVKFKSTRKYFDGDETMYIMDAKVKGNIGRYLNHSCNPNVFVQNVFTDTHDLRFPQVAFFALNFIPAGRELTWDYNYEVGCVENKVLYCHCESKNCRGRLL